MSKSKFALVFAFRRATRERHCNVALAKCVSKIEQLTSLLDEWRGRDDDDIRWEFYRPRVPQFYNQVDQFKIQGEANPKRTAGAVITFYRNTLNPLLKQISREMQTQVDTGHLVTLTLCDFPNSFLPDSQKAPKWVDEVIKSSFIIRITGPKTVLDEGSKWETIHALAMEAVAARQESAWERIRAGEREITNIFKASPLNWSQPLQVTQQEILDNSDIATSNVEATRAVIESINTDIAVLMTQAQDEGEVAARNAIQTVINIGAGAKSYQYGFRKRAVKSTVAMAGNAVGLISAIAGTIASGGTAAPTLFISVYSAVMAASDCLALLREGSQGLKQSSESLNSLILDWERMIADNARIEAALVEAATVAAGLIKIPGSIYGDLVNDVASGERHLGQYQYHLDRYMKEADKLLIELHNILNFCKEIRKAAKDAGVEDITVEHWDECFGELNTYVKDSLLPKVQEKVSYQTKALKFEARCEYVVRVYKDFSKGPLQKGYATVDLALQAGAVLKDCESVFVAIGFGVKDMSTPIGDNFPADLVDILAALVE